MLKNYKIILSIIVLAFIFFVVGLEVANYLEKKEIKQLNTQYDTRLYEYYNNELLAKTYLEVFTITDDESYQSVKYKLNNRLSKNLMDTIFVFDKYPLQSIQSTTYEIKDIKGEMKEDLYIFKIEYVLLSQGFKRNMITIIKIENEKIIEVITL